MVRERREEAREQIALGRVDLEGSDAELAGSCGRVDERGADRVHVVAIHLRGSLRMLRVRDGGCGEERPRPLAEWEVDAICAWPRRAAPSRVAELEENRSIDRRLPRVDDGRFR